VIPALHMYLLGDFLLVSDDTPVTTVNVSRVQSLLAYLVLHRSSPQDRSHLAYLLWPDSTEAQAHSNLVWLTEIARLVPTLLARRPDLPPCWKDGSVSTLLRPSHARC